MNRTIFGILTATLAHSLATLGSLAKPTDETQKHCIPPDETPIVEYFHDFAVTDPFRGLEKAESQEVLEWMKCEDESTHKSLFSSDWYPIIKSRLREISSYERALETPRETSRGFYFNGNLEGQRGIFLSVEPTSKLAPILLESELLNASVLKKNERIREFQPSPDGRYVGFGFGDPASNWVTWRVFDTVKKEFVGDPINGFHHFYNQLNWLNDSSGFYYSTFEQPSVYSAQTFKPIGYRVGFRRIVGDMSGDRVVFAAPKTSDVVYRSAITIDNNYLVLTSAGLDINRVWVVDISVEEPRPALELFPGVDERFIFAGGVGSTLYFGTSHAAPRRRLVAVDLIRPEPDNWQELVSEEQSLTIDSVQLIGDRILIVYLEDAIRKLRIFHTNGRITHSLEFPYIGWVISRQSTGFWDAFAGDWRSPRAFFTINGQADPGSLYELNVHSGKIRAISRPKLAFDPDDFATVQVFYESHDGESVPMYLAFKKGLLEQKQFHPVWIYAYGYNWSSTPYFMPEIIPWMEAGGIYAFPSVRGGGEYGQPWIEAGSGLNSLNKISDFIWAAKWFVEKDISLPRLIIANGGSSSGPLPASAINMEPSLYAGAVIDIPLLDMIGMFRFLNGVITNGWGDIEIEEDFENLLSWSPYHNISAISEYPPTYVYVGEKDQFAPPLHGLKYVALRKRKNASRLLLDIGWGAGHYIDDDALVNRIVFGLETVGLAPHQNFGID